MGSRLMENQKKEHTIKYEETECKCEHLTKFAPMWFLCDDCGKIFNFILSMQFTYEKAVQYFGDMVDGLDKSKELIKAAELKRENLEKENEEKALKEYKESLDKKPKEEAQA